MGRRDHRSGSFEGELTLARLVVEQGPGMGAIYPLYRERIVIGRISSSDLQLDDGTVSRLHARISLHEGDYYITDLGSHSGTLVNREAIEGDHLLRCDDRIELGQVVLRFDR